MAEYRLIIKHRSDLPAGISPSLKQLNRTLEAVLARAPYRKETWHPDIIPAVVDAAEFADLIQHPAIEVHPDIQLSPTLPVSIPQPAPHVKGLPDVLEKIHAPQAWNTTRGADTFIAIIDTGICGTMAEFDGKKADGRSFDGSDPWKDDMGHGSMTACIAAGTQANGGRMNGVAPDAMLYSCKTSYYTSDLIGIYEWLLDRKAQHGKPIIANNSFAWPNCQEPEEYGIKIAIDHPFVLTVQDAVAAGITVVFSAGNNHEFCGGNKAACGPDTIWVWNSIDEVLALGAVDEQNNILDLSSRGPGQFSNNHPKPDCVAPTFGEVMYGCGFETRSWGTSGAAPQAAGLAALCTAKFPGEDPFQTMDRIRNGCTPHPTGASCSGAGVINCEASVT